VFCRRKTQERVIRRTEIPAFIQDERRACGDKQAVAGKDERRFEGIKNKGVISGIGKKEEKMKIKKYILLYIAAVLFVSCLGKKKDSSENVSLVPQEEEQIVFSVPVTEEQMRDLINKNERRIIDRGAEIAFIEKANFGVPGGDNWIIRLNDGGILIYSINDNRIDKRYYFSNYNVDEYSFFDIMRDIPGTHIGNSTSSFGDFNGDGNDEIFQYAFGGNAYLIGIDGYDPEKDDIVSYTDWITFELIDREFGPAPVEFMTYQGMYGFKVRFFQSEVAGGPDYVYEPNPKNGKWIFYTWDEGQREYVEVGEVTEEE
jgi:hypothetical protein